MLGPQQEEYLIPGTQEVRHGWSHPHTQEFTMGFVFPIPATLGYRSWSSKSAYFFQGTQESH